MNFAREGAANISIMIFSTLFLLVAMNLIVGVVALMAPAGTVGGRIHPLTYVITTIFVLKSVFIATMSYIIEKSQTSLINKINIIESEGMVK